MITHGIKKYAILALVVLASTGHAQNDYIEGSYRLIRHKPVWSEEKIAETGTLKGITYENKMRLDIDLSSTSLKMKCLLLELNDNILIAQAPVSQSHSDRNPDQLTYNATIQPDLAGGLFELRANSIYFLINQGLIEKVALSINKKERSELNILPGALIEKALKIDRAGDTVYLFSGKDAKRWTEGVSIPLLEVTISKNKQDQSIKAIFYQESDPQYYQTDRLMSHTLEINIKRAQRETSASEYYTLARNKTDVFHVKDTRFNSNSQNYVLIGSKPLPTDQEQAEKAVKITRSGYGSGYGSDNNKNKTTIFLAIAALTLISAVLIAYKNKQTKQT